ncbi:hypothetical protein [Flavobacterium sp. T12S277]|uniref:hypothetical protein n=1 Tax=Flavobacterium sp. T12S277 TaxID=3402752 RepID=UPI003ADB0B11
MRNFTWSFLMFFCFVFTSFSQTKTVEKGTYLSANKGQNIKLNLLENNKYELVFYSGDYKIKGDSVLFTPIDKFESGFDLAFKNDKKAKKVKIKFINPSFYSFFIGSQNGSNEVKYQRLSDIWSQENTDNASPDAEFEIDRADYLYLVCEDYKGESKISKFALPKEVSEVTINYQPDLFGDLNIVGFFNKNTNELMVSERPGKDPLVFVNEKDALPERMSKVVPLEIKSIVNWTYPGKEIAESEVYAVVDSAATAADSSFVLEKYDFKLKVENNLKSALSATKESKTKFQVVVIDSKNASAKTDFEAAVKDQETQLAYTMYDSYHPEYDLYNYYLTTAEDKKWLKTNKITDTPVIVILDSNGEILASAKASLKEKQYHFNYYDDFYKKLQRTSGLLAFNKTVKNKKSNDTDFIQAFNKLAVLETPYDYDVESAADENPAEFKFVSTVLDKKEVAQIWKKLIETHQKDTKPNMYLVETILKEIKNQGFSKQFFSEDRVLNDTDFLSIDYLIKHYDAIDTERLTFNVKEGETHSIGSLNTEIALALQQNQYVYENDALAEKKNDKTIAVYKKLINAGKGNFECYQNYFTYLAEVVDTDGSNTNYLKEFTTYFKTNLATDKGSAIEKLDEMFASIDPNSQYSYNGWNSFKEYHSNLCNSAAWTVVSKPGNNGFMKSAIGWSEYSLAVTKNNPYYLDTLAQLYYKDGQKEKAVQTQLLATKYLNSDVAEETASEIRETLTKMQNGTY